MRRSLPTLQRLTLMKTFRTLLLLLLTCALPATAQVGEYRNQLALGFNAGLAMNTVGFDPRVNQQQLLGPHFGVTFRYTSERYFKTFCAIQLELNYARLGWNEDILDSNSQPLPDTYKRLQDWLQLPMLARLGWGKEKKGLMFYFLAGPQIGYCLGEKTQRSETWTTDIVGNPDRPNGMYAQYDMPIEHRFEYGITAGLGTELNTKLGHFLVEGRYYYGLSDLFGNSKKDVFGRSNNNTIYVKFSYLFDVRK